MADSFTFELVTPEKPLVCEAVTHVIIPGTEGHFTVLKEHAPLMSTLEPGVVEVHFESGHTARYFVRGGLVDVTPHTCTLLAEYAENVENIDLSKMLSSH